MLQSEELVVYPAGPGAPAWKKPTMVTLTVVAMLSLLVGLFWFIGHCRPYSCKKFFEKVPLPSSLVSVWIRASSSEAVAPPAGDVVFCPMLWYS